MKVDPLLNYCQCGHTFKFRKYHKILMLLRGEYKYRCPQCQTMMTFKLMNHVVKVDTKAVKNRDEVYKNG